MPEIVGGKTYLNQGEVAELLNITTVTFRTSVESEYALKPYTFIGKGRSKFYLQDAIEAIRERPGKGDLEKVKEQIQALQSE